jgi:hypothetical protein
MALKMARPNSPRFRGTQRGERRSAKLEAVRISSSLIAFYPEALYRPQPYVILLEQGSGILKHLDLQAVK